MRLRDPRQAAILATIATALWNGIAGTVAIVTGLSVGSLALFGFGLEAGIDAAASAFLAWRFHVADPLRAERLEYLAQRGIGLAFLVAGAYIAARSIATLTSGSHADPSTFAIAQAAASLIILPGLGLAKLRLAKQLDSPALRGDGILTTAAALLAATTLLGLIVTRLLGQTWPDPAAAIIIAALLLREGHMLLRRA